MKTLEEFYKEYYPPKMHLFRDKHDRELQVFGINDMVDFAEQYAKAVLEEAAENIEHLIKNTNSFKVKNVENERYTEGLETAKYLVSFLIPKDTTKD